MHRHALLVALLAFGICTVEAAAPVQTSGSWRTLDGKAPLVIAHRGASGYRPEHTLASYTLAIEMGADYIEPDLVATSDGHLVARHEPLLDDTTDVKSRPQFASRRTTSTLDGKSVTGFFASDFTLAEIKQLRAVQSNAARSKEHDGRYEIPTFEEILDLAERASAKRGRAIGIYPETKHPSFHLDLSCRWKSGCSTRCASASWIALTARCSSSRSRVRTCSTCARRRSCLSCSCSMTAPYSTTRVASASLV